MYGAGRYLTITGQHIENTPTEIKAAPQTLELLRAAVEKANGSIDPQSDSQTSQRQRWARQHILQES